MPVSLSPTDRHCTSSRTEKHGGNLCTEFLPGLDVAGLGGSPCLVSEVRGLKKPFDASGAITSCAAAYRQNSLPK